MNTILRYSAAVRNVGGVHNVWGFIDGTMCAICRPIENQRLYYSGYKKCHAIKFQAIVTPDGLISHLSGPCPGSRGDWGMYLESGLERKLRHLHVGYANNQRQYLYGDPAYNLTYDIFSAYQARPRVPLLAELKQINTIMSELRISVKHGFGKVMMLWGFNGFRQDLKIGLSPVAAYFMIDVFFSNIHTCIYQNQTSQRFNCMPPSIENYLSI